MSTYVTAAGLAIPSLQDLLDATAAEQRATIDPNLDVSPDSPMGLINGIVLSVVREAWEVLNIAYHGNDPDAAEGYLLDSVSAFTGTKRQPATPSTFAGATQASVNLNAATTVPAGTIFAQLNNPAVKFTNDKDIVSVGAGNYLFDATCTTLGAVACAAGTLTVIVTPVAGLNSVTNAEDAILGEPEDSDSRLRIRRESELRATGSGTVDSLRADVLSIAINGVQPILSCFVFENETDAFDANGLPPHSLEVLIYDGLAAATSNNLIAQTIWDSKPGGIRMGGGISGTAKDALGGSQTVPFSRPTIREIEIEVSVVYTAGKFVGTSAVRQAVLDKFNAKVTPGSSINCADFVAACMAQGGVINAPLSSFAITYLGNPFVPGVDLQLAPRDMGDLQIGNITVIATPG